MWSRKENSIFVTDYACHHIKEAFSEKTGLMHLRKVSTYVSLWVLEEKHKYVTRDHNINGSLSSHDDSWKGSFSHIDVDLRIQRQVASA